MIDKIAENFKETKKIIIVIDKKIIDIENNKNVKIKNVVTAVNVEHHVFKNVYIAVNVENEIF